MTEFFPDIFRIQRYSIHDGPGIRTTLFFQGCPLSCAWCHNPESQPMVPGGTGPDAQGEGQCNPARNSGCQVQDIIREIEKDLIYYDESGGGVTFSGGEPLCRPGLLMALIRACEDRGIRTCLDTSGHAPFSLLEPAARAADLVLYDIKVVDDTRAWDLTGKSSRLILDNLEKLSAAGMGLRLRFPLIPGMTDTRENIRGIADFLIHHTRYRKIHILPFHNTGEGKYKKLGLKNPMENVVPPDKDRIRTVARAFTKRGLAPIMGG